MTEQTDLMTESKTWSKPADEFHNSEMIVAISLSPTGWQINNEENAHWENEYNPHFSKE